MKHKYGLVGLILIAFVFSGCSAGSTSREYGKEQSVEQGVTYIDAFSDLEVSFEGFDGYGEVTITNLSDNAFLSYCEYTADKVRHLSNGDVVNVTVSYLSDPENSYDDIFSNDYDFISDSNLYTVSGLDEPETLDIFDGMEQYVTFSGGNGGGRAVLDIPTDFKKEISGVYFVYCGAGHQYDTPNCIEVVLDNTSLGKLWLEVSPDEFLSEGDSVSIVDVGGYSKEVREALSEYGYTLPGGKNIVVPSLGGYLSEPSQITKEVYKKIGDKIYDDKLADISGSNQAEWDWDKIELDSIYFGTVKDGSIVRKPTSCWKAICRAHVQSFHTWTGKEERNFYIIVEWDIDDWVLAPDGTLTTNQKEHMTSYFRDEELNLSLEEIVAKFDPDYKYEKIAVDK